MLPLLVLTLAAPAEPAPLFPAGKVPFAVKETEMPTLQAYLPPADKATGAGVVVCPGGGYGFLAADHEGSQVAEFFNTMGVAAFVLKYRIVGKDRPGPLLEAPLLDTQRALRTVRAKAKEYGLDPAKIGLMGFSAGGHLASTGGTRFDAGKPDAEDPIDRASCRPDFLILAYPVVSMADGVTHGGSRTNLIGKSPTPEQIKLYSNELNVSKQTPPTFLFHTGTDTAVLPENSLRFYSACKAAGVPAELHVYEKGPHGVGLGRDPKWIKGENTLGTWPDRLTDWLKTRGVVK